MYKAITDLETEIYQLKTDLAGLQRDLKKANMNDINEMTNAAVTIFDKLYGNNACSPSAELSIAKTAASRFIMRQQESRMKDLELIVRDVSTEWSLTRSTDLEEK